MTTGTAWLLILTLGFTHGDPTIVIPSLPSADECRELALHIAEIRDAHGARADCFEYKIAR